MHLPSGMLSSVLQVMENWHVAQVLSKSQDSMGEGPQELSLNLKTKGFLVTSYD